MMTAITDRAQLASPRLGFPNRHAARSGGYSLPQRLIEGSRLFDNDMRAGLAVLRGSRFEAGAPERL